MLASLFCWPRFFSDARNVDELGDIMAKAAVVFGLLSSQIEPWLKGMEDYCNYKFLHTRWKDVAMEPPLCYIDELLPSWLPEANSKWIISRIVHVFWWSWKPNLTGFQSTSLVWNRTPIRTRFQHRKKGLKSHAPNRSLLRHPLSDCLANSFIGLCSHERTVRNFILFTAPKWCVEYTGAISAHFKNLWEWPDNVKGARPIVAESADESIQTWSQNCSSIMLV